MTLPSAASTPAEPVETLQYVCVYCKGNISETRSAEGIHLLCSTCKRLPVKCKDCSKRKGEIVRKPLRAFDLDRVMQWKRNNNLNTRAVCIECEGRARNQQRKCKYIWKQTLYQCGECLSERAPREFDTSQLSRLEADKKLYLAVCASCALQKASQIHASSNETNPLEAV